MSEAGTLAVRPPATAGSAFLRERTLAATEPALFRQARPFPWATIDGLIEPQRYQHLRDTLPSVGQFRYLQGRRRRFGQQSHDRFVLDYDPHLPLAPPWHAFVRELQCGCYRRFVGRLLDTDRFRLSFHWHYTPRGCSVSPHCDADWKLGSHIFYFNGTDDWRAEWGGETLILDDRGEIPFDSAPGFDSFAAERAQPCMGNASLVFQRTNHSWHGVRPLNCPARALRKIFVVEFVKDRPMNRFFSLLGL